LKLPVAEACMTFRIGAHVSVSGGVEKAVDRQDEIGGNCGQIFAGSPRTWSVAEYSDEEGEDFQELTNDKDQKPYVIHSTYLVNLATPKDDLFQKSLDCLQAELDAASTLGVEYVVFHPGAHTGSGRENGIERIAEGIDELDIPENVTLLLENTAGKGTTLGKSFGELRQMIELAETPDEKIGVCIDTCHAHAAGYDLRSEEGFGDMMQEIEEDLGLDVVKAVHLNDSKDPRGSEKDNHQHIGQGNIGDEGFRNVVNSRLGEKPMVLETPVTGDRGYAENLERILELRE
jgi:deoxyribonuclease-4